MTDQPLLLAGTRVTGAKPHLGTFYGWIRPIVDAAGTMDVVVLVADLQSLDPLPTRPVRELAIELETTLRHYLPPHVPIVRESAIPSLPVLGRLALPLFAEHHWRRIAPLRKLRRTGQAATVATMLYPAMMIADVLTFGATHVLAKPEGRFQHTDVLNDVITRGAHRYQWPTTRLTMHPKPKVEIRSADGAGPMKRNRPGFLPIDATADEIIAWTATLNTPGSISPGEKRQTQCRVAWPLWQASAAGKPLLSIEARRMTIVQENCVANSLTCGDCIRNLATAISDDLNAGRQEHTALPRCTDGTPPRDPHSIATTAEITARDLIRQSLTAASGA